jgi:hypothetical protein
LNDLLKEYAARCELCEESDEKKDEMIVSLREHAADLL